MNILQGLRILNTRPAGQNQTFSQMIREVGAIPIELPAIEIQHIHTPAIDLAPINQMIFTSANAINGYFACQTAPIPPHITLTAIGQASALCLKSHHYDAHHIPNIENSEHLLRLPHLQLVNNQCILLIKGIGGRTLIEHTLSTRHARVITLNTYQRVMPKVAQETIDFLWHQDAIDILLFTSQEAMYNLFTLFGEKAKPWLCSKLCIVISERLAMSARTFGIKSPIVFHQKDGFNTLAHHIKGRMHDNEPSS